MKKHIMACIDGSVFSEAVCEAAMWSAQRLNAPLHLLNVTDETADISEQNYGSDEQLERYQQLDKELQLLEQKRASLAEERSKAILDKSMEYIGASGSLEPKLRQYKGTLLHILEELEDETRLLILGKGGRAEQGASRLGSHLEQIIRTIRRPMLVVMEEFVPPKRIMMAFDGSVTTAKGVQLIADSPYFKGIECHVVQVGSETDEHKEQMLWAEQTLEEGNIPTKTSLLPNTDIDQSLSDYADENQIDLMIMGAYSHSRVRQLLFGSNTSKLLEHASRPLLILR